MVVAERPMTSWTHSAFSLQGQTALRSTCRPCEKWDGKVLLASQANNGCAHSQRGWIIVAVLTGHLIPMVRIRFETCSDAHMEGGNVLKRCSKGLVVCGKVNKS